MSSSIIYLKEVIKERNTDNEDKGTFGDELKIKKISWLNIFSTKWCLDPHTKSITKLH